MLLLEADQLKLLIKDCIREVFQELFPYPSSGNEKRAVYTRNEIAKILKVAPNTVSKYIRQRKLHGTVLNGKYRISDNELSRFINDKK